MRAIKRQLALCSVTAVLWIAPALTVAAPKAASAEECFYAADIALTTRSMILERVNEDTIRAVLLLMYRADTAPAWITAIMDSAKLDKRNPQDYAKALYAHCTQNRGGMDAFFGLGA